MAEPTPRCGNPVILTAPIVVKPKKPYSKPTISSVTDPVEREIIDQLLRQGRAADRKRDRR